MRYQNPELLDRLAAEYVLGTLQGQARRRYEKLLAAHPSLRQPVRDWELRLNKLTPLAPTLEPPPQAWQQLEQRLFHKASTLSASGAASAPQRQQRGLGGALAFWRGLALGSSGLAAALALLLWLAVPLGLYSVSSPEQLVMIEDSANRPIWMLTPVGGMGEFVVKSLEPIEMPQHMGCVLWARPLAGEQLYPVGRLPDSGEAAMLKIAPGLRKILAQSELFVTVETMDKAKAASAEKMPMPAKPSNPPRFRGEWVPLTTL